MYIPPPYSSLLDSKNSRLIGTWTSCLRIFLGEPRNQSLEGAGSWHFVITKTSRALGTVFPLYSRQPYLVGGGTIPYHTNHTNHRHQHLPLHSLQHHIKLMVQAYHHTSPTPRLGMLAPPPLLFTANRKTLPNETQPPGCTNDQASRPTLIPKLAAPVTVLADASSSEDEGSLSDASSYRDFSAAVARPKHFSLTSRSSTTTNHTGGTMPASTRNLPFGRPLRAKPRLFKRRASYKAGVPQKLPVQHSGKQASTPSPTILQRSCYLSQDEKLFLEAAATLAQASRE